MRCIFFTLIVFFSRSALTTAYSFNFALVTNVVCGHVNFEIVSVIGFEVTLAALEEFLVEMYSICVISHSLDFVSFELADLASNYF